MLGPNPVLSGQCQSILDKTEAISEAKDEAAHRAVNPDSVAKNYTQTSPDKRRRRDRVMGLEPTTFSLGSTLAQPRKDP